MLPQMIALALTLTFASASTLAEDKTFIECSKDRVKSLDGLNDQQLYEVTQQNLVDAAHMVALRAEAAKQQGLVCYNDFNTAYGQGVMKIMGPAGEQDLLNKARSTDEKAKATKELAAVTQYIICDEKYRAKHVNDSIECNFLERNGAALAEFSLRLPVLETIMGIGGVLLKGASPPMASAITQIKDLYTQLYATGKSCSLNLPANQTCRNLKMFNLELRRLDELAHLIVASKLL